jgi:hypothetical protein
MIFEAYHSKRRLLKLITICLIFVAVTAYFLGFYGNYGPRESKTTLGLVGKIFGISRAALTESVSWITLFGALGSLIIFLRDWFYSGPVVRVDQNGIWDVAIGKIIRWDNIEAVFSYSVNGQKFIGLNLNDRSIDTPNRRGGLAKWFVHWLGTGDIAINLQTTNGKQEDFLAVCAYWRVPNKSRMLASSNFPTQQKSLTGCL